MKKGQQDTQIQNSTINFSLIITHYQRDYTLCIRIEAVNNLKSHCMNSSHLSSDKEYQAGNLQEGHLLQWYQKHSNKEQGLSKV